MVSPNITLTLERVPTEMAGGVPQTEQRIGIAAGTAALTSAFRLTVSGTRGGYPLAESAAMACSTSFMVVASVLAVIELPKARGLEFDNGSSVGTDQ